VREVIGGLYRGSIHLFHNTLIELSASLKDRGVTIQYSDDGRMPVPKKLDVSGMACISLTDKAFGTYLKSIFAEK
jgi:hypothetical protein